MWSATRSGQLILTCLALTIAWTMPPHLALARSAEREPVLRPAPRSCPATPAPRHFEPAVFGPGWGGPTVWAVGLGDQSFLVPGQVHSRGTPGRSRYGWGEKILWAVGVRVPGSVTLRGWNLSTGQAVNFKYGRPHAPTDVVSKQAYLDARASRAEGHNKGPYEAFPTEEYFPSAGCYVLYALSRTGSWILPVAFGR
jgi:hypothetical protein